MEKTSFPRLFIFEPFTLDNNPTDQHRDQFTTFKHHLRPEEKNTSGWNEKIDFSYG